MDKRSVIHELRYNERLSIRDIARRMGLGSTTIFYYLGKTGYGYKRTDIGKSRRCKNFWNKVNKGDENACWEWKASKTPLGYGRTTYQKRQSYAHRMAYIYTYSEIPDGLLVCHTCDNPACCNPKHLFLGSHKDNTQDMIKKGRSKLKWCTANK